MGFGTPPTALPAKYPFWSEIITQEADCVTIPAQTEVTTSIQPPSGETWLSYIDFALVDNTSGSYMEYRDSGD